MKIRDEYDKGVMREMDNNYAGYIREKWGAFSQLQGRAALDAKQQYEDDITAYRVKMSKDLDPRLNNTFNAMADVRTNNAFNRVSTHVTSQTIAYNKTEREARIELSIQDFISSPHDSPLDKKAREIAFGVGISEINDKLKDMGIDVNKPKDDGERAIIAQAHLAFSSKAHTGVINELVSQDMASTAEEYFDDNINEIDASTRDELRTTFEANANLETVQTESSTIMKVFSASKDLYQDRTRAEEEALLYVEDNYKGQLEEDLKKEIVAKFAIERRFKSQNVKAAKESGWQAVDKGEPIPKEILHLLDGTTIESMENHRRMRGAGEQPHQNWQFYSDFITKDDAHRAKLMQNPMTEIRPYVDDAHYEKILGMIKVGKSKSFTNLSAINGVVKHAYNINSEKIGKQGGDANQKYSTVVDKVWEIVYDKETATGKKLNQKEIQDIVNEQMIVVSLDKVGWDEDKYKALVTSDEWKKAYVAFENVPENDATVYKNYLISKGITNPGKKLVAFLYTASIVPGSNAQKAMIAKQIIKNALEKQSQDNPTFKSNIISETHAKTLAEESEDLFSAVDIGYGKGDIENMEKLKNLSAEHIEALILTEDWSDDNLIILEDLLEKKLKQRIDKSNDENSSDDEEGSVDDSSSLEIKEDRGTLTKRGYRKKSKPREGKDMTDYELTKRGYRKKSKPKKDKDKSNDENSSENKNKSGLTRRGYRIKVEPKKKIKKVKTRRGYR